MGYVVVTHCYHAIIIHIFTECGALGLAIDNTGSGVNHLQIALDLVEGLERVPFWTLTTFKDFSKEAAFEEVAPENVDFLVTTDNVDILKESMAEINFSGNGGGDIALRATQG